MMGRLAGWLDQRLDGRWQRGLTVTRAVVHEIRVEQVTFMAGSIAYHALVSLLPLLVLLLAAVSTVGGSVEQTFLAFAGTVLTPSEGGEFVARLRDATRSRGVSLLGSVALLWGTLRIFRGLDAAFSDIYETQSVNSMADQLLDGGVVLVTFALTVLVAWAMDLALSTVEAAALVAVVRPLVFVFGLALTFLPMYYVFPDTDVSVQEVLPGVFVAAGGLSALHTLFEFYVAVRSPEESVVASVIVVLTWFYFTGLVVLIGAAVNAVLADRSDDVSIDPVTRDAPRSPGPDREPLVADLDRLVAQVEDAGDAEATEFTVQTGEETVDLPAPRRADIDVDAAVPLVDDGQVRLVIEWETASGAGSSPVGDDPAERS